MTSPDAKPAKADASAVEVLRSLEWSYPTHYTNTRELCPVCFAGRLGGSKHKADCRLAAALQSSSSAEAGDPGSMRVAPSHGNAEGSGTTSGVGAPAPGPSDGLLREQLQKEIEATITAQAERDSYRDAMLIAIEQRDRAEARAKTAEAELRERVQFLTLALDDQINTPCEQIRHKQDVERFHRRAQKAEGALVRHGRRDLIQLITRARAAEKRASSAEAERDALRAENERLREALKPFSDAASDYENHLDGSPLHTRLHHKKLLSVKHLRCASSALNHGKGEDARAAVTKDQGGGE